MKKLLALIDDPSFEAQFFPDYASLQSNAEDVRNAIQSQKTLREQFQQWRQSGELIETEFTRIEG
ncbi:hypothetical protein NJF54_14725 [Pseudomonas guariconensis]|uniref:hypothetical protein n=1 Tax=Pseudomonas TaxID=286 RepID=UPI001CE45A76|nr:MULTISPECIES: hypothetical protein [Pseudomonas]MCO7633085.1 hypothetical protein [Pseudomonas guariconensis]